MRIAWIGIGGAAGAMTRYAVEAWISARAQATFPFGTLVVNVTGCFLLGFLIAITSQRFLAYSTLRAALAIGFLGAYTTFSTFAFDSMRLAEEGSVARAAINVVANVAVGVLAVVAGTWLGRSA